MYDIVNNIFSDSCNLHKYNDLYENILHGYFYNELTDRLYYTMHEKELENIKSGICYDIDVNIKDFCNRKITRGIDVIGYNIDNKQTCKLTILNYQYCHDDYNLFEIKVSSGNSTIITDETNIYTFSGFKTLKKINRESSIYIFNPNNMALEATYIDYIKPLGKGNGFTLTIDNRPICGYPIVDGFIFE